MLKNIKYKTYICIYNQNVKFQHIKSMFYKIYTKIKISNIKINNLFKKIKLIKIKLIRYKNIHKFKYLK